MSVKIAQCNDPSLKWPILFTETRFDWGCLIFTLQWHKPFPWSKSDANLLKKRTVEEFTLFPRLHHLQRKELLFAWAAENGSTTASRASSEGEIARPKAPLNSGLSLVKGR